MESLPVACTLGPDDGRSRQQRWQRLHERAVRVARLDGGELEVRYRPGPGVREELTGLAEAERACCSFAEWTVMTVEGDPTLRVTASPEALVPLAALFGAGTSPEG